jgi:hypothetical protein
MMDLIIHEAQRRARGKKKKTEEADKGLVQDGSVTATGAPRIVLESSYKR